MSRHPYAESVVEEAFLEWLGSLGYEIRGGPDLTSEGGEREDHRDVVLRDRLHAALERLNPEASAAVLAEAERQLFRADSASLVHENRRFHRFLVNGVEVEVPRAGGGIQGLRIDLIDFAKLGANDWPPSTSSRSPKGRRTPAGRRRLRQRAPARDRRAEEPGRRGRHRLVGVQPAPDLQGRVAGVVQFNELLVVSDGVEARLGSLTAPREWFLPWRTIEGDALAPTSANALEIRDEVAFFQTVKAALVKTETSRERAEEDLDHAIRQIVSSAIAPEGVIDVFEAAGLAKPDISILSDEFIAEVRELPQKNLAVELLRKLLNDELRTRSRTNLVESRAFSQMLEATIRRYQNRAIETAQVIEELIALAKEMREAGRRGEELGLSDEELAFYDALETNDSAVQVLGDETLRGIARELADTVRRNATIDWTVRESARAKLRVLVRRILRNHGYPPDKQERATLTVLEQAELLGYEWAGTTPIHAPFRFMPPEEAQPFVNCIPLYSLAVAAGAFSGTQEPEPEAWVEPNGRIRPAPGLFVAQVVGESMNRRIPDGAYCVFRAPVEGSRNGRVLPVEHRDIDDPETGGHYTVKVYESAKAQGDEGWRHTEIRLKPDTDAPGHSPILLREGDGELRVIAELVEVLGP